MAAKKKTVKRKAPAAKPRKVQRAAQTATLPEGFKPIGGFGKNFPDDDTKAGEAIQGVITDYNEDFKTQHGLASTCTVESEDGEVYTVWKSAALGVLFEEDYTDVEIWLRFDGLGKKKGKNNPPKLFTLAINEA